MERERERKKEERLSLLIDIFRLFCCIPRDVSFSPLAAFVTHKKIERNSPKFLHPRVGYFIYLYIYFFFSLSLSFSLLLLLLLTIVEIKKCINSQMCHCEGEASTPCNREVERTGRGCGEKRASSSAA